MKSTYFFDTSAVVKFYHQETGTEWVESIFSDEGSTIVISELTTVEFHSAVAKKIRTGEIEEHAGRQALRNFQSDCADRFLILPLDSKVIRKAKELINRHGSRFSLRTLDALQLAACQLEETREIYFVCADTNLMAVCRKESMQLLNPENPL